MKIGNFDGTSEEFNDLVENHGFNPNDFLETKETILDRKWLLIPVGLIIVVLLILSFSSLNGKYFTATFVAGLAFCSWLIVCVQIRFKNSFATFVSAMCLLLLLLVSGGIMDPKDTPQYLKDMKSESN